MFEDMLDNLKPEVWDIAKDFLNVDIALNLITAYAGFKNPTSEDCLGINVWTKPQTGEKKKGTLVIIVPHLMLTDRYSCDALHLWRR